MHRHPQRRRRCRPAAGRRRRARVLHGPQRAGAPQRRPRPRRRSTSRRRPSAGAATASARPSRWPTPPSRPATPRRVVVYRSLAQGQFDRYGRPAAGSPRRRRPAPTRRPTGCCRRPRSAPCRPCGSCTSTGSRRTAWPRSCSTCYAHAQRNPRAIRYGTPLTREEYHALALDRRAVPPLRLLPGERRRRRHRGHHGRAGARPAPRRRWPSWPPPTGSATATACPPSPSRTSPPRTTARSAELLWQRAGAAPADVDVAQFYENFTGPGADGHRRDGVLRARAS